MWGVGGAGLPWARVSGPRGAGCGRDSDQKQERTRRGGVQKAYSTRYSQAVSHPSTNQARPCLASEIRRDRARSGWYGRRRPQPLRKAPRACCRRSPAATVNAAPLPARLRTRRRAHAIPGTRRHTHCTAAHTKNHRHARRHATRPGPSPTHTRQPSLPAYNLPEPL